MDEVPLLGGNSHAAVVRAGDTVRRPTGPHTAGVHALLRHLETAGFPGAPRVLGIDEQQREILSFVDGDVVWPDRFELVTTVTGLEAVAGLIRSYHDAVAGFDWRGFTWSERGGDPTGPPELVCHDDLAPWNLVHRDGRWTFIDWDAAAPGRRDWDLAWALLGFVPLLPDGGLDDDAVVARLRVFAEAYGRDRIRATVLDVAVERCAREADLITTRGAQGEAPFDRLLADGHAETWADAATHVSGRAGRWKGAFS